MRNVGPHWHGLECTDIGSPRVADWQAPHGMTEWHQQQTHDLTRDLAPIARPPGKVEHQGMHTQVRQKPHLAHHMGRFEQKPAPGQFVMGRGAKLRQQSGERLWVEWVNGHDAQPASCSAADAVR